MRALRKSFLPSNLPFFAEIAPSSSTSSPRAGLRNRKRFLSKNEKSSGRKHLCNALILKDEVVGDVGAGGDDEDPVAHAKTVAVVVDVTLLVDKLNVVANGSILVDDRFFYDAVFPNGMFARRCC